MVRLGQVGWILSLGGSFLNVYNPDTKGLLLNAQAPSRTRNILTDFIKALTLISNTRDVGPWWRFSALRVL